MADLKLAAQPRTQIGRKVRQLREAGLVPIVVYGKGLETLHLQVSARNLERVFSLGGGSQLLEIVVEGGSTTNVLLRELQRNPVNHRYLHADFYAVNMLEKQEVTSQVIGVNAPEFEVGLMMLQALDSVTISALPSDIPASIEVDLSELSLENSITIADLPVLPGVEYVNDLEEAVFTVIATREEELDEEPVLDEDAEPEVIGEEGEAEDGQAQAEESEESEAEE
jgi:large subunit ribosomal protein L25